MSDFYNKYPYTDFHELNLDWVIERVKKLTEDWQATSELWQTTQQAWTDTEQAWIDFKEYVETYLANLDVQDEIDHKINQMIANGTFLTIVTPLISQTVIDAATDWLAANITQPTTPAIDTTLTIAGAAADAKATGDRITPLENTVFFDNLFDKNSVLANSELLADPSDPSGYRVQASANTSVSDFIKTEIGKIYYFGQNGTTKSPYYVYSFTPGKIWIQRINGSASFNGFGGYIRVCINNAWVNDYQINIDSLNAYSPYGSRIDDLYTNITGINTRLTADEADIDSIEDDITFDNIYDKSDIYPKQERDASTGVLIPSSDIVVTTGKIPVKPGTIYFSANDAAVTPYYVYYWNLNDVYSGRTVGASTYVVSNTVGWISICFNIQYVERLCASYKAGTNYEPLGKAPAYNFNMIDVMRGYPDDNPLAVIKETPGYLSCFLKVGCIGDSLASGLVSATENYPDDPQLTYLTLYDFSWGQFLARETGNTYYNFSRGGLTTKTWLESSYATQCYDGSHNCTAYIIGLGQNDQNTHMTLGTIADINDADYTLNPDTFYGNYGKIIQKIREMFPLTKPKIFLCTDPLEAVEVDGYNQAIRDITNHFSNVWLIDLYTYARYIMLASPFSVWKRNSHYNAPSYLQCAYIIQTYIDWIIRKNPEHFRNIELIDTPYTGSADERA